ncbi:MAG TPA: methyltransferase domain-containing protein [Anaerolineae bacterium]|nr:methyltransferase domain-containing protein [Anaerolineae bacterium]
MSPIFSAPTTMPTQLPTQPPDYWPLFEAYHRVREPVYRTIIADARLPTPARVLDAGCGDAFYSRLLVDALERQVRVIAVDHNAGLLQTEPGPGPSIQVCLSDLERIGLRRQTLDVIWSCRAMHSARDPVRRLAALAPLLRPGGKFIVVENDLAHCPILSWPAEFEDRVRTALHQYLRSQCPDGASIERYHAARHLPAWLERAGLTHVSIHTYPVEDVAPMPRAVEAYWVLAMGYLGKLIGPHLSDADRWAYTRAFDPQSPDYLLNRPGFYCLEPLTVGCGTAR